MALCQGDVQDRGDEKQNREYDGGVEQAFFNATLGSEDVSGSAERRAQTCPALLEQDAGDEQGGNQYLDD
jgi:hypothetical protein